MTQLNVNDGRCEALFASGLQRSDLPSAEAATEAISRTVRQFGVRGCAALMAQEFGDHPEAARDRMLWVRQVVGEVFAPRHQLQGGARGQRSARWAQRAAQPATGSTQRAA
jgi:hypothetical protein